MKLALLLLAACSGATYYVPATTRQPIERSDCADARGDGVVIAASTIVAERAGSVDTTCRDGRVRVIARPAARVAVTRIDRPVHVGESVYLHADLLDADGNELHTFDLGWTLVGMHEGSACDHMLGTCVGHGSVHVIVDAPGASGTAHFGSLAATVSLDVRPR